MTFTILLLPGCRETIYGLGLLAQSNNGLPISDGLIADLLEHITLPEECYQIAMGFCYLGMSMPEELITHLEMNKPIPIQVMGNYNLKMQPEMHG